MKYGPCGRPSDPRWTRWVQDCRWCGEEHFTVPGGWAPKACIEALHNRREWLLYELHRAKYREQQNRRDVTELADLRLIVRDQRHHIKNLEEQLLPLITDHGMETEAML